MPTSIGAAPVQLMPRYVILEHDHPYLHWDLMLETGFALRTWRLAAPPQSGAVIAAENIFNHRLVYLDYEGPLSDNRGQVRRWDSGTFQEILNEPDRLIVKLAGQHCSGTIELQQADQSWSFLYIAEEKS